MSNLNLIINICYLVITSGVIGALGNYLSKHMRNKHFADGLKHAQTISSQLVAKYANDPSVPKGLRREGATHDLKVVLDAHGYHFNRAYLLGVVEHAYQVYKHNGGNIVEAEKVAAPVINDVKNDTKSVVNNDVSQAKSNTLNPTQVNNILAKNRADTLNNLQNQGLINK